MKFLYKITLFVVLLFSGSALFAQNGLWSDAPETNMRNTGEPRVIVPSKYRTLTLDTLQLKQVLKSAPMEFTAAAKSNPLIISLPMPDGSFSKFSIVESPIQEPGLAAKFPDIKTYSGQGIDDKTATIKMDWTGFGFHAMISSAVSGQLFIDPYARGNKLNYISYDRVDLAPKTFVEEGVLGQLPTQNLQMRTDAGFCVGTQLRTYRFAVACTGEYAVAVGGTNATLLHSAIVTTVNRVNGVYEKETAIRLVLIANNTDIEFLNSATDPFNGNNNANTLINESQNVIDTYIGSANYDIGHTFSTGGGGLAQLGCVCTASKARGITGSSNPTGDAYDIDYVAHEVGHQFGGGHTFNSVLSGCSGNRSGSTAVEPGSGVTIMGYAGLCGADNLANNSIPVFHSLSLNQIGSFSNVGSGNNCAAITNTGNSVPVVNAGADYTIPFSTPFVLTGSATDANNDALTYSWEEIDLGAFGAVWNSGSVPFFRSFNPTLIPTRYFPKLSDVVNSSTTVGEILPTSNQTLNFRLTVRDNRNGGGGVCSDEMVLGVSTAGGAPFTVSSQAAPTSWTANGTNTATITWNVAGTTAAPFNTANVSILFSADGGQTFPFTLALSTPNDGSENIVIPSIPTTNGRIMVKAVGNVFFNVNGGTITITSSCSAEGAVVAPSANVSAVAGSASLNLGLTPQYTAPLTISGTLVSGDPSANLAIFNVGGVGCISAGNVFRYQSFTFTPSITGSYTFTRGAGTSTSIITNIYTGSFNSASVCSNFLASNGTYTGSAVSIAGSFTANLTAGNTYVLNVGTFNTGSPALPAAFSVNVSSVPAGGVLYSGSGSYNNPGASFSYNYVIVNNANNNIVAISNSANLSNAGTYPSGTYTVYGLSFANSIAGSLAAYVGGNFNALATQIQNNPASFCANLSKNAVTVSISPILPVNFIALKARKQGTKVLLEWGTVSEQNSSHFSVQRSSNGVDFNKEIARVNAAGTSNSVINYNTLDAQPNTGWSYYRIKQFDLDGKFAYSNVAAINFDKGGNIVIVYPNPAKDKLNMEYTTEKAGKVQIQVVDSKGAVVLNNNIAVAAGRNINSINISSIAQGVYVLKCIDADGNNTITKFIKQ